MEYETIESLTEAPLVRDRGKGSERSNQTGIRDSLPLGIHTDTW